ncbi:hypothetical protein QBC47DRAFT_384511 [Echria macrotheca]|uniref:HD/PDEase domain-containing protein n=1 Tax=Echria macrotheca TaxID=438768 RepID=A0AAJ0BAD6_9PEZI|nr:hypothetical protein QBC47DRAFT_384511 [Echria macrotheca]
MSETMDTFESDPLVQAVTDYVKSYMSHYDASHDWNHIQRVLGLARHIYSRSANRADLDLRIIHLAALLHDVGDRKYLSANQDPTTIIATLLLSLGAPPTLAAYIQTICLNVSYTTERKNPPFHMASLIQSHPELAVVQDADRIDALGAVGIGRMFTYGGARCADRDMAGTMAHLDEKLFLLEGMAKTEVGRGIMRERTERMRLFKAWWAEEVEGKYAAVSDDVGAAAGEV